jgi:hypothetical protein
MIQRDELHRAFDGATQASERRSWKYGQLGRPDGTIAVADRPGFVYVRLSSDANQSVTWARNPNRVPLQLNLPVKMRNEGENLVIIDVDTSAVWEASTGGSSNPYAVTHHTHRIGTGLEYEVEALRLEPGRVYPAGGLTATVNPFRYYHAGAWATYAGTTLSLGPYRPSTTGKHRWIIVCVDPDTNALAVVTGTDENYATTLTAAMLDSIDTDNYIPLVAVQLRNDDTSVESYSKYLDARGWINVGAGDYTDEAAQDAIGDILQASATITPNYVDATPALSFAVNDNSITFAKMADIATDRLIGRDTAGSGDPEAITVGGGLEFTGSAGIQRSALTGDVTAAAGSNATTIANNAVTLAKLADMNTDRLLGRDTASTGDPEEITVGGGLEFTGSGGIQRSALTGDVTASAGSNATTIANDAVTNAKLADMAQATIKGRAAGAGTGDPTDLSAAQVATIAQGSIDHGSITGLGDDDHSIYALLAGRSGGQTLNGDTASGGNLTLHSTAHATKGKINLGSASAYDQANDRLGMGTTAPATALNLGSANATLRFGVAGAADSSTYGVDVAASGGSTNSGNGRSLTISAGASDNTAGKTGGTLTLRPGAPASPATAYGTVNIADLGGSVGVGTSSPDGLQINASVSETARGADNVRMGVVGGAPRIILEDSGSTQWQIDNTAGLLRIFNPGTVRADLNTSGVLRLLTGRLQVQGATAPASGTGVEVGHDGTTGVIISFDRSGTLYKALRLNALQHEIQVSGSEVARWDSSGNLGLRTTSPQGPFHIHDGVGGYLFVTKTAVGATPVVLIPNAAGDVTGQLAGFVTLKTSGGGVGTANTVVLTPGSGDVNLYGVGGDVFAIRCNADGSVDVRRTAGALTYTITASLTWN